MRDHSGVCVFQKEKTSEIVLWDPVPGVRGYKSLSLVWPRNILCCPHTPCGGQLVVYSVPVISFLLTKMCVCVFFFLWIAIGPSHAIDHNWSKAKPAVNISFPSLNVPRSERVHVKQPGMRCKESCLKSAWESIWFPSRVHMPLSLFFLNFYLPGRESDAWSNSDHLANDCFLNAC